MNIPPQFVEVADYYYIPFWQTRAFSLVAISMSIVTLLLVTILTILLIKRWRERKNQPTILQRLCAQLDHIKPEGVLTPLQLRGWYGQLTHVLKTCLYHEYGIDVRAATDEEVHAFLEKLLKQQEPFDHSLPSISFDQLVPLFKRAACIKFAPDGASAYVHEDWECAKILIDTTKTAQKDQN